MREDPKDVQAPHDVASALWYIGTAENRLGNHIEATVWFRRAMPLAAPLLSDRDDLPALILSGLADSYDGSGRLTEALRMRRQALEQRRAMLANQPGIKKLRRNVVADQNSLGATLVSLTGLEREPAHRLTLWRQARAAYEEGLHVSAGLDAGGQLEPADASIRELLRRGLARCDQALRAAVSAGQPRSARQ
jgi:tetratricopeptide (TPR) repeat protein